MKQTKPIDLMFAEPGTVFRCNNEMRLRFTNRLTGCVPESKCFRFEIVGITNAGGVPAETYRFRDGSFNTSSEVSGNDIVAVESEPPKIDLGKVPRNRPVRLRNNSLARTGTKLEAANDGRPYRVGAFFYTQDGRININNVPSPFDVVYVLSDIEARAYEQSAKQGGAASTPSGIAMDRMPIGTKFRRRDGRVTTLTSVNLATNSTYPYTCNDGSTTDTYTPAGRYMNGEHKNPKDLVKVFKVTREKPLSKEEVIPALLNLVSQLPKEKADQAKILLEALR